MLVHCCSFWGTKEGKHDNQPSISEDDTDEEITEVLGAHGRVTKIVRLKPERAIIEFDSEEVVAKLNASFPCEIATARDPTLKWCLDSIEKMVA